MSVLIIESFLHFGASTHTEGWVGSTGILLVHGLTWLLLVLPVQQPLHLAQPVLVGLRALLEGCQHATQLLQRVPIAKHLLAHGASAKVVHVVRTHELIGRAGTANGRQETARLANLALTPIVV